LKARWAQPVVIALAASALAGPAVRAERIDNRVAVFAALDKVTARTSKFEVPLNETHKFGALKVTPRVCYSRPPTEQPKTTSFVEVTEIELDGEERPIFTGWMFAESPALNAVEHPVFDVWLTGCQKPQGTIVRSDDGAAQPAADGAQGDVPEELPFEAPRRRVRR
jgi:hypothetical protein